jgi:hypothetical protein
MRHKVIEDLKASLLIKSVDALAHARAFASWVDVLAEVERVSHAKVAKNAKENREKALRQ